MEAPLARAMKSGVPPTARKALTGESTPPGRNFWAALKRASDLAVRVARQSAISAIGGLRRCGQRWPAAAVFGRTDGGSIATLAEPARNVLGVVRDRQVC